MNNLDLICICRTIGAEYHEKPVIEFSEKTIKPYNCYEGLLINNNINLSLGFVNQTILYPYKINNQLKDDVVNVTINNEIIYSDQLSQ